MTRPGRLRSPCPDRSERGSGTVLVTVLVGLLVMVALGCGALGGLLVAQRKVAAAADLAALAGAGAVQHEGPGQGQGCTAAQTVAEENGGTLRSCRLSGEVVTVEVSRAVESLFGRRLTLTSLARAGPGQ